MPMQYPPMREAPARANAVDNLMLFLVMSAVAAVDVAVLEVEENCDDTAHDTGDNERILRDDNDLRMALGMPEEEPTRATRRTMIEMIVWSMV